MRTWRLFLACQSAAVIEVKILQCFMSFAQLDENNLYALKIRAIYVLTLNSTLDIVLCFATMKCVPGFGLSA